MEATALLRSAGKQLGKWMVEEAKYLYAVKDKVEGLQSELEWIQCFLRNADEKKNDDEMIHKWIAEINDFSYEAEDILEKYLLKVSHPRKKDGIWNTLKWATCALGDVKSTHQVGLEIDVLTSKISKLSARMVTYGVKPESYGESSWKRSHSNRAELRRTHSHLPVDDIVGLENDTEILVGQLMNKETKVIAISGMPGSGKTTLARKLYHSVKGGQFEKCAWIYVSQEFQPKAVIKEILHRFFADDQKKKNEVRGAGEQLEGMLYRVLEEKKCLVVLDDIWKSSHWNSLKSAFPITANSRSKLLITTRYNSLVSHVDPQGFLHQIKLLNEEESLKLFDRKAFYGQDPRTGDPRTQLRKQMVAQCKGLPLAIVVMGGILAPKRTLEEWESVHKNIVTFFRNNNDEENGLTGVLELSYTDLPYHLRPCFLHLGNFPEDYEIPTKKLYRMWIAEGIVAPRDDKPADLENIANSYLQELVQRCIVQVGKRGPAGKIKTCRLHDSMRDMCTSKAKEESFLSIVRQGNTSVGYNNSSGIRVGKLHRLAIHFGQSLQSIFPCQQFNKAPHLRSLMFFSIGPVNEGDQGWLKAILNEFKLLRVLDLEHTGIEEVPKEIGTLIHLRYLSIMGTQVRMLPSSIGKLRCLQTLDLRVSHLPDNRVMKIPNVLWRMKRLKHLYLPSHPDNFTPTTRIPNVSWRKRVKLKHLNFPSHTNNRVMRISNFLAKKFQKLRIKGLSNLEILKNFDTRRYLVNDLRKLENLRKLSIKNVISKAETLKIILDCQSIKNHSMNNLEEETHMVMRFFLKIHASVLNEDPTILKSCSCLHTLEMAGTESPLTELRLDKDNVMFPEKLMILYIKNCKFMCVDPVTNIEQLRNLTTLSLHNVSFPENCMDFSNASFLQLVHLKLSTMKTLKEWRVGVETMPKLHRLQIEYCDENLMIPDGLPTSVEVVCHPCVKGFDKYSTCPFVPVVDDDDDDLATQYCTSILS